MSSDSDDRLRAANFDPKPSVAPAPQPSAQSSQRAVWIAGAIGLVLLAFVIFVLPSLAPEPSTLPSSESVNSATNGSTTQEINRDKTETEERSPFAEAQMAKARRAAQEALQQLLETQARLEARAVNAWAEAEFADATAVAVEGDVFYREQRFNEAETRYRAAQSALDTIEAQLPDEIAARLKKLLAAVEASDMEQATDLSQTLSQMAPDNADVVETIGRVPSIPEVAVLIESASTLFAQRSFKDALEQIQAAIALDPAHKRLQGLEQIQAAIALDPAHKRLQ